MTPPKKNRRRDRGATWLAIMSVISCLAVGISLYHQMSVESSCAPWEDRVSTLARQIGFGRVLDRVENWSTRVMPPATSRPTYTRCVYSAALTPPTTA
jgi:hypothetical protein